MGKMKNDSILEKRRLELPLSDEEDIQDKTDDEERKAGDPEQDSNQSDSDSDDRRGQERPMREVAQHPLNAFSGRDGHSAQFPQSTSLPEMISQ